MLTLGHLSASYLLAQVPSIYGVPLTIQEQVFVVAAGYVLDLDLFVARFFVKKEAYHHLAPTHTPLFALALSVIAYFLFRNRFSTQTIVFGSLAMLLHLVLDDTGYWLYKFGWQKISPIPQIFWFYPFDKRRKYFVNRWQKETNYSNLEIIHLYLTKAPANAILELALTLIAIFVFLKQGGII